jgi:hypothetical protein
VEVMNMRLLLAFLVAVGVASSSMAADWMDQRLSYKAGEQVSRFVPIEIPFPWEFAEDATIGVRQSATGRTFPAQVRDGILSFVAEGSLPGAEHIYLLVRGPQGRPPRVEVREVDGEEALAVFVEDSHFTTYHFANAVNGEAAKKTYLWPVLAGSARVPITRGYPMIPTEDGDDDHPHHRSFYTAFGNVNGADLWAEGANSGVQFTRSVSHGSGDAYGWILADNEWRDHEGNPVVDESREYRFYAGPASVRLFDLRVTFTAAHGPVTFGDTKEGGIAAMRVAHAITASGEGTMTTSAGVRVDRTTPERLIWGLPAAWLDYYGPVGGAGVHGIAILDHPSNPRHPTRWHARKYGLVGANVFGLSDFTQGEENGDLELAEGESLTFRYRIVVHEGDTAAADIAARFADFATPPETAWVE